MNKEVLGLLVLAQIASDQGKRIHDLPFELAEKVCTKADLQKAVHLGYRFKKECITKAIRLCEKDKESGFRFFVKKDVDHYWWSNNVIIYFNFKVDGKKLQCSFHNNPKDVFINEQASTTHWIKNPDNREALIKALINI